MGRKGGGRAGFLKAARRGPDSDEEEEAPAPAPAAKEAPKPGASKPAESAAPAISAKAAAFLVTSGDASDSDSADGEERSAGGETRGQMVQRHKREAKALKDQVKRMGKKSKDEAARLEAETAARHAAELATLSTAAAVEAVAEGVEGVAIGGGGGGGEPPRTKKPTKAQRRREEKAARDAEREARIAAEVADLGETERAAEEKALARLLAPRGLAVKDIPADGHCLYRSFQDQLAALPDGGAAALAAAGAGEAELSFQTLRSLAAGHMRAHADAFRPFIDAEEVVPGGADGGEGEPVDSFEAYCAAVEGTAAWGGHVEIEALARALHVPVTVYSAGLAPLEVGAEFKGEGRAGVTLCYLRHAFGLGEHYNSVQARTKRVTFEGDSDGDSSDSGEEE